jgi:hypothetical protein
LVGYSINFIYTPPPPPAPPHLLSCNHNKKHDLIVFKPSRILLSSNFFRGFFSIFFGNFFPIYYNQHLIFLPYYSSYLSLTSQVLQLKLYIWFKMKSKEAQMLLYISPTCFFPQNNFFIQMNF